MTLWFRRLDVFIATECSILPFFDNIFECPFCPLVISYQDVLMIQIQHVSAGTPRAWWHCQEETTEIRQLLWAGEVNSRHGSNSRDDDSWKRRNILLLFQIQLDGQSAQEVTVIPILLEETQSCCHQESFRVSCCRRLFLCCKLSPPLQVFITTQQQRQQGGHVHRRGEEQW